MRRMAVAAVAVLTLSLSCLRAQVPGSVTLPEGTKIKVDLRSSLDTAHAGVGERVQAVTTSDVKVHGKKLLPRGSQLVGSITAVTPAESSQSPSHLGILFTQARTKDGQVLQLEAAITGVQRLASPEPMMTQSPMPVRQSPEQPDMNANDRAGASLGSMAMPAQVTGPDSSMNAMVMHSRQAPLAIRIERGKGSVLTSRGNFKLSSGTRLELQELPSAAGAHAGAGSH